jgi:hypothetical protein
MRHLPHLFLHPGHWTSTMPLSYARFVNVCEERVVHDSAVHVNVSDSRGSRAYSMEAEAEEDERESCLELDSDEDEAWSAFVALDVTRRTSPRIRLIRAEAARFRCENGSLRASLGAREYIRGIGVQ